MGKKFWKFFDTHKKFFQGTFFEKKFKKNFEKLFALLKRIFQIFFELFFKKSVLKKNVFLGVKKTFYP